MSSWEPLSGTREPSIEFLAGGAGMCRRICIADDCSGSIRGGSGGLAARRGLNSSLWPAGRCRDSGVVALRNSEG